MNDMLDLWAFDGSFEIKALDSGRFEGLAVPFGDPDVSNNRDIFTSETNFGRALKAGSDLLYYHGLPSIKTRTGWEKNPLADIEIGEASFEIKDSGVWMKGQMALRGDYEAKVWEMVKGRNLGLSTGVAAHRARREKKSDGTHQIKSWPIDEVSLTPTPAHPRTSVYALKSLIDEPSEPEEFDYEALKAAVSALRWASGQPDLNRKKADALKSLTEAVRGFNASRIDPERIAAAESLLSKLTARYEG